MFVVSHVVNVFASALKSGQICKTIVLLYSSSVIRTKFIDYFSDELHNTPTPGEFNMCECVCVVQIVKLFMFGNRHFNVSH